MDLPVRGPVPVGSLLRSARAIADLSQRSLAERAGVPKSLVSRLELDDCGDRTSVAAFVRLLDACGITLTAHSGGRQLLPDDDPERDRGRRRYPPHLDPHPVESIADWWGWLRTSWDPERAVPPPRIFHTKAFRRSLWRDSQPHPPHARFWADTAHLAPPYRVHPQLERRRQRHRESEAYLRKWRLIEEQVHRDIAARRAQERTKPAAKTTEDLPPGDGAPDELGGEVAQ